MTTMISADMEPSYYAILNVARDASDSDVRKAFRHLSQAYHPDKHTGTELQGSATTNFTFIQEAYEVQQQVITSSLTQLPAMHV